LFFFSAGTPKSFVSTVARWKAVDHKTAESLLDFKLARLPVISDGSYFVRAD
jgi:hypothetical protein